MNEIFDFFTHNTIIWTVIRYWFVVGFVCWIWYFALSVYWGKLHLVFHDPKSTLFWYVIYGYISVPFIIEAWYKEGKFPEKCRERAYWFNTRANQSRYLFDKIKGDDDV